MGSYRHYRQQQLELKRPDDIIDGRPRCADCGNEVRAVYYDGMASFVTGDSAPVKTTAESAQIAADAAYHQRRNELEREQQWLAHGILLRLDHDHPAYVTMAADNPGYQWAREREAYVLGDDGALDRMLAKVTPTVPYLAPIRCDRGVWLNRTVVWGLPAMLVLAVIGLIGLFVMMALNVG